MLGNTANSAAISATSMKELDEKYGRLTNEQKFQHISQTLQKARQSLLKLKDFLPADFRRTVYVTIDRRLREVEKKISLDAKNSQTGPDTGPGTGPGKADAKKAEASVVTDEVAPFIFMPSKGDAQTIKFALGRLKRAEQEVQRAAASLAKNFDHPDSITNLSAEKFCEAYEKLLEKKPNGRLVTAVNNPIPKMPIDVVAVQKRLEEEEAKLMPLYDANGREISEKMVAVNNLRDLMHWGYDECMKKLAALDNTGLYVTICERRAAARKAKEMATYSAAQPTPPAAFSAALAAPSTTSAAASATRQARAPLLGTTPAAASTSGGIFDDCLKFLRRG